MTDRGATALRSSPRFRSSPRPSLHRQHFNRQTTRAVARTPGGTRRASGGIQKPPGEPLRRSNRAKPVNPDLAAAQAAAQHARVARARAQARSNPSNPRISEEEDSGEEEDSDDEKKEGEQNSLPSPTIDDAAPPKFQFSLLKRFARRNGVSYEKVGEIMIAQSTIGVGSIVPMRPTFAVVNYIKDEINEGRIQTPLKLVDGMCGCHSCQALGSSNSLGCAFHDLTSDFV